MKIRERIGKNQRKRLGVLVAVILLSLAGCGNGGPEHVAETEVDKEEPKITDELMNLAEGYREIYGEAAAEGTLADLEVMREITEYFGRAGYAAVDINNQINMLNYEQAEEFCVKAQNGGSAGTQIVAVRDDGGFIHHDLTAEAGNIHVKLNTLQWADAEPYVSYSHEFDAYSWKYTDKGYLLIEEYRPPGYDGAPGQTGLRIRPLDEKCRELNRKYVMPVGYAVNNLMITNWNEQDFSALEFYDLYEILYRAEYGEYVPYEAYEGAEYEVPAEEFETVIQKYFQISRETLAQNTLYNPATGTYRYHPRGLKETEEPYEPYPEVTAYEELGDGTIRLSVEAVWIREMEDCVLPVNLTVRPLEDGGYQYVSCQIISWGENVGGGWYAPRLTAEQWKLEYGE